MYRISIAILLISIFGLNRTQAQTAGCTPSVENIRFDGEHDLEISRRISVLGREDQAIRQPDTEFDLETMIVEDRARREEILGYLQAGQVVTGLDLFYSALIFQHGDCPDHYHLAAQLAWRAHELGHPRGGWLYGAATDRYLLSIGQLQRYGTQYIPGIDGHFYPCPIEPGAVTDEERTELGLPTLEGVADWGKEIEKMYPADTQRIGFMVPLNPIVVYKRCFWYQ